MIALGWRTMIVVYCDHCPNNWALVGPSETQHLAGPYSQLAVCFGCNRPPRGALPPEHRMPRNLWDEARVRAWQKLAEGHRYFPPYYAYGPLEGCSCGHYIALDQRNVHKFPGQTKALLYVRGFGKVIADRETEAARVERYEVLAWDFYPAPGASDWVIEAQQALEKALGPMTRGLGLLRLPTGIFAKQAVA